MYGKVTGSGLGQATSWVWQGLRESLWQNKVNGDSDMVPACLGGGLNKGTMTSASTFVWKKADSIAFTLKPDNSIPPYMPFELLLQGWSSERVSLSASTLHASSLRKTTGTTGAPISLSHNLHRFSQPEVVDTSLPSTGTPN